MDTLYAQRDATDTRRLWLTRWDGMAAPRVEGTGKTGTPGAVAVDCPGDIKEGLEGEWEAVLGRARLELGLQAGDTVAISASDPSLHARPWEMLGGRERAIEVIRLVPDPGRPGSHQLPPTLRILLALPEDLAAPVRLGLDSLQREAKVSLTTVDAAHLAAHLTQPGYFHAAHLAANAPCLASVATLRRRLGRGRISLLVIHGETGAVPLAAFAGGDVPCVLIPGVGLSPTQAAGFLRVFYTDLLESMGLVGALRAGCAMLEPDLRSEPLLLTGRPGGEIWPLPRGTSQRDREPAQSLPSHQAPRPTGERAAGIFVGGNVNVQGDVVTGSYSKTVYHAGDDMVVTNRGAAPTDKIVQTAGRDMVAINRSTGTSDRKPEHRPGFCPVCNEKVGADHAFCPNCGMQLARK